MASNLFAVNGGNRKKCFMEIEIKAKSKKTVGQTIYYGNVLQLKSVRIFVVVFCESCFFGVENLSICYMIFLETCQGLVDAPEKHI